MALKHSSKIMSHQAINTFTASLLKRMMVTFSVFFSLIYADVMHATSDQTSQDFGKFTIHYNAFNSDTLQPSMAEAYNIVRSKNRGILTLTIIKKDSGINGKAVRAKVTASASNLTGQFRKFNIREIVETGSVYYISAFHVAHEEMLDFVLHILPEGETKAYTVKFRQQFFTQ